MAKSINTLAAPGQEAREVHDTLERLHRGEVAVQMEIENTAIHFTTQLTLRSATVIVAKPVNLAEGLAKGGTVRFNVPGLAKDLRMEVLTPHFNDSSGAPVFLCKVPDSYAESSLRGSLRYSTAKFTNVMLTLAGHPEPFRVVDLSEDGCRVFVPGREHRERFPIGQAIQGASIVFGDKMAVQLNSLTPRNLRGQAVGCQLQVAAEGESRKRLLNLMNTLERSMSGQFPA